MCINQAVSDGEAKIEQISSRYMFVSVNIKTLCRETLVMTFGGIGVRF